VATHIPVLLLHKQMWSVEDQPLYISNRLR
jgi:hypothetical protein